MDKCIIFGLRYDHYAMDGVPLPMPQREAHRGTNSAACTTQKIIPAAEQEEKWTLYSDSSPAKEYIKPLYSRPSSNKSMLPHCCKQ